MLSTLILALTLSAAPADTVAALAPQHIADAERDVAQAAQLKRTCWTPAECAVAHELAVAADAELSAARALVGAALVRGEPDPFAPVVDHGNPFVDDVPEATEADAAWRLAAVQTGFDDLAK